ncbi:protein MEI2-like 2 [Impatiens glandulifera]|uniref:protein MEI2-like 2 n=1 Tax=Impatiens glandulifera TaxID=253017 RepID=UPI001FB19957|nr:protein MEI2-like 2 [Impatiens glandulifera]XP_047312134.1 protein MEI2-like 2 [Impatiens glandulifera]
MSVLEEEGSGTIMNVPRTPSDASLFSTSLPVLPHGLKKNGLRDEEIPSSVNEFNQDPEDDDSLFDELAAIGSLLPDEDELLAGIMDDFEPSDLPHQIHDVEDYDLFGSGGGMELESDPRYILGGGAMGNLSLSDDVHGNGLTQYSFPTNGSVTVAGEHPYGEHPSRTLFVRNINSNVEDSELSSLFEQYGDIRTLYTACKHRGFVMISYYDIRDARTAMKALQNKPLRRRKLDIHFSIPKDNPSDKDINQGTLVVFNLDPSVSNDDLLQIFGVYGEIKEIRETPHKRHHKFIEFFDVRAAEAALRFLNRSDIAGKRIKLEPSRPGGARRNIMFQLNQELEQDESRSFLHQIGSPITSSPPGNWPQMGSPIEHGSFHTHGSSPGLRTSMSPNIGNGFPGGPGLASILHPQVSSSPVRAPNSVPIRGFHMDHNKFNGIGFQQSHSLTESSLSQYPGPISSFGASSSNGSAVEKLSGPQFLWGSPGSYPGKVNSSGWQMPSSVGQTLMPNGNIPYGNRRGPFVGLSQLHHVGSAPSGVPIDRHLSYRGSPDTSFMNLVDPGPVLQNGSSRISPVFIGNGYFPGFGPIGRDNIGSNQFDNKKQFQLDLDKIRIGEDTRTTLMIKNIPNKYTSKMLLGTIDEKHMGTYDFLYLPIDFKNKCNVGYAFINMMSPSHIISFYESFNGKKWEKFNSEKVASLAYARIQGKAALVSHFQNSSLMNEDKRCRPILFHSDGSEVADQMIQEQQLVQFNGPTLEDSFGWK